MPVVALQLVIYTCLLKMAKQMMTKILFTALWWFKAQVFSLK